MTEDTLTTDIMAASSAATQSGDGSSVTDTRLNEPLV